MKYRRIYSTGGVYFFTVVTFNRQPVFVNDDTVDLLCEAFRVVMKKHPFQIQAFVLLSDHLHTVWKLPEGDSNYPTRWRFIKSRFTHTWKDRPDVVSGSGGKRTNRRSGSADIGSIISGMKGILSGMWSTSISIRSSMGG